MARTTLKPVPPICPACGKRLRMPDWMAREYEQQNKRFVCCDMCGKTPVRERDGT